MKKVFVNPKASIKRIINKAKEWNGTYRGYFIVGDEGQEVSLELTYRNDSINPPYMFGKVKWGDVCRQVYTDRGQCGSVGLDNELCC